MKKAGIWLWVVAVAAVGVGLFSYRYLFPSIPVEAPNVAGNRLASTGALVAHAGVAATALILGAIQFFPEVRRRWPTWHRRAGTVYVLCCMVGGLAGFVLAFGTTAGPVASLGFGTLAVFWLVATGNAWRYAKARDFVRHQRWMTRSYAMTFGAVTLRLYLPLFALLHVNFMDGYRLDSWLAWVPNLIFAELVLLRPRATSAGPAPARG